MAATGGSRACNSIRSIIDAHLDGRGGWGVSEVDASWVRLAPSGATTPSQGWKLHVSASVVTASEVLERALPVLLDHRCAFKVVATTELLAQLNREFHGASQAGKFVTVYPGDDAQAVRLAVALDAATAGLAGPRVRSDRALRPGSLVHYRYGAFTEVLMQTPLGEVVTALRDPEGALVPDRRRRWYSVPDWAEDPFEAAGVHEAGPATDLMVGGRYLTASILASSAGQTVRLVVDLEAGVRRVLKEAHADSSGGHRRWHGAAGRLRHEAAVLTRLAGNPHTPNVYDVFEEGGSLFVAMDHFPGLSVEKRVYAEAAQGRTIPLADAVEWVSATAEILGSLHRSGLVYGDLKPPHLLVTDHGELRLVDLESVTPAPAEVTSTILGTPGYLSPQRARGNAATTADDIYALGATLRFVVTGDEPSFAPNRQRLIDRPIELFNRSIPEAMIRLIRQCLHGEPGRRPASTDEFRRRLQAAVERPRPPRMMASPPGPELVGDLASRLCDDGPDQWSPSRRDVDGGGAGVVLALAQAAPVLGRSDVWKALSERADWLARTRPLPGGPLPGLYVGEAGVGAALLRAGQVLGRDALVERALAIGRSVSTLPHRSPDLFNGSAGRLRFHLMLWRATGDRSCLEAALKAGEVIVNGLERRGPNQVEWRMPEGYGGASGLRYLGYAHGVAGIADALLDLHEITGEGLFCEVACSGAARLIETARRVGTDGQALNWPETAEGTVAGAVWCHGAAGITRFLAHCARVDLFDGALEACLAGARTTAFARRLPPGQCHGLAGNAEVLIDVYQATGQRWCLDQAHELVTLMGTFLEEPDALMPPSPRLVRSSDLLNGWAGLLTCALRTRSSDRTAHLMSVTFEVEPGRPDEPVRCEPSPPPGTLSPPEVVRGQCAS